MNVVLRQCVITLVTVTEGGESGHDFQSDEMILEGTFSPLVAREWHRWSTTDDRSSLTP